VGNERSIRLQRAGTSTGLELGAPILQNCQWELRGTIVGIAAIRERKVPLAGGQASALSYAVVAYSDRLQLVCDNPDCAL
jgi:hypothetical protein